MSEGIIEPDVNPVKSKPQEPSAPGVPLSAEAKQPSEVEL